MAVRVKKNHKVIPKVQVVVLSQAEWLQWLRDSVKSRWNRVALPHRWSIVCRHQSGENGRAVHSSAHGLLKRQGCFWMPEARTSFQRYNCIEPIYLPLYQLRRHFLIYMSIWFFSLWRMPPSRCNVLGLLCMQSIFIMNMFYWHRVNISWGSVQNRCKWLHLRLEYKWLGSALKQYCI